MVEPTGHVSRSLFGRTTALVVVDVQNDFADPKGSLSVRGGEAVVEFANGAIESARSAGSKVAYTQDWHPPETPHFEASGGVWPAHCVRETWGAAFHPDLVVHGEVIRKAKAHEDGYSGFTVRHAVSGHDLPTHLAHVLHAHGVRAVVVIGLATDYCVRATALDAIALGFRTIVLTDGVAAVDLQPGDGERALSELAAAGVVIE